MDILHSRFCFYRTTHITKHSNFRIFLNIFISRYCNICHLQDVDDPSVHIPWRWPNNFLVCRLTLNSILHRVSIRYHVLFTTRINWAHKRLCILDCWKKPKKINKSTRVFFWRFSNLLTFLLSGKMMEKVPIPWNWRIIQQTNAYTLHLSAYFSGLSFLHKSEEQKVKCWKIYIEAMTLT